MSMNEGLLLIAVGVVVAVLLRFLAARRSAVKQEGREALDQRVADEAERQAGDLEADVLEFRAGGHGGGS